MQARPDISTVELTRTRVALRSDITFVPQQYGLETWYHIEVHGTSEYYRLGYAEYCFVSLLDGHTSFAQALAMSAQAMASQNMGDKALSQTQAQSVYSWLLDRGIARLVDEESATAGGPQQKKTDNQKLLSRLNPLWMRIPLGRPEPLLRILMPWTSWIFSGPATFSGIVLMMVAGVVLTNNWQQFTLDSSAVFAPDNWLWLFIAWFALKLLHEFAHAIVCLRYGGSVNNMGIVLAFLAPLAYVDASSSWSFRSRWRRIHTALAGIYVELLIAAICVLWWSRTDSRVVGHLLHSIVVMASLSTIVFNINPLMRFDGYFVLSDALNIPNLYSEASTVLKETLGHYVFGESQTAPAVVGYRRPVLLTYAVAAVIWRLTVCLTLLIAASVLFHGAGIALALAGALAWFAKPVWKSLQSFRQMAQQNPDRLIRGGAILGLGGSTVSALLLLVPAPLVTTAPGIIEYRDGQIIRSVTPGFVDAIFVSDGQMVKAGDRLLQLRNNELETEYAELNARISQEEVRFQLATREHNAAGISIARANLDSMHRQRSQLQKRVNGLTIVAETDGRVLSRQLPSLLNTFVQPGQELITIGMEDNKELICSVSQLDISSALQRLENNVPLRIGTHGRIYGKLERVNPRATDRLPHPALAASSGGQLAVCEDHAATRDTEDGKRLRLTEQRFDAVIQIAPADAINLRCGERGVASLGLVRGSFASHLYRSGQRWFQTTIDNATRRQE
ncbi:MAG: biotin/lipoyl-binding protein [Planctomycetaceae bacterium]